MQHKKNYAVLQHMKNNISLTKQIIDFTVSTFDSCDIETISQEFLFLTSPQNITCRKNRADEGGKKYQPQTILK
jgi:hypothetical protein